MRSNTLIRSYQRARLLRRVMLAAFAALVTATLLWVIPWVPFGLTAGDYNTEAAVAVALASVAWASAFGVVYLRDQGNRYEQALVTWTSVHDQLGDLRRREYFYERVVLECMRSERSGIPFGVFTARFGNGDELLSAEIATALEALGGLVRQTDSLAAIGPQEVGVLGAGMGNREAPAFAYRLKSTLETSMGARRSDHVSVGWAIWDADGRDAGSLVAIARQRMQRKSAARDLALALDAEDELSEDDAGEGEFSVDEAIAEVERIHQRRDDDAA